MQGLHRGSRWKAQDPLWQPHYEHLWFLEIGGPPVSIYSSPLPQWPRLFLGSPERPWGEVGAGAPENRHQHGQRCGHPSRHQPITGVHIMWESSKAVQSTGLAFNRPRWDSRLHHQQAVRSWICQYLGLLSWRKRIKRILPPRSWGNYWNSSGEVLSSVWAMVTLQSTLGSRINARIPGLCGVVAEQYTEGPRAEQSGSLY